MSAAASPAAKPARPALADRDCSNVKMSSNRSSTFTAPRQRHPAASGAKDSYAAAAASNPNHGNNHHHNRNHHNNNNNHNGNVNNHMTRRRSFHSNRSGSSHSQAAQEGYFMRKAAKAIAEKRKAAAAAAAAANGASEPSTDAPAGATPEQQANRKSQSVPSTPSKPSNPHKVDPSSIPNNTVTVGDNDTVAPVAAAASAAASAPANAAQDGLPQQASVPVINVTVDSAGVRIRDGPSPGPGTRGPRRASQARLSRSASRNRAADDKENNAAAGNNETFSRRPSKRDLGRRPSNKDLSASGSGANLGKSASGTGHGNNGATKEGENSWDGSMPRRQSSRGLIERNARVENRAKRTPVEQDSSVNALERSFSRQSIRDDEVSSRHPRQHRGHRRQNSSVAGDSTDGGSVFDEESVDRFEFRRAQSQIAVSNDLLSLGLDVAPRAVKPVREIEIAPKESVDTLKVDIPPSPAPEQEVNPTVSTTKATHTAQSETSEVSHASETSEARSSSSADSKMPTCGKWCDSCAGLGMTIAAMLAELETTHPASPTSKRPSSAKKSWRSVVSQTMLGSGESRSALSERTRLMQENTVLRTTVDFLYKKMAEMEQAPSAAPQ